MSKQINKPLKILMRFGYYQTEKNWNEIESDYHIYVPWWPETGHCGLTIFENYFQEPHRVQYRPYIISSLSFARYKTPIAAWYHIWL